MKLKIFPIYFVIAIALLTSCATTHPSLSNAELQQQVIDTENAFANTMAQRDVMKFSSFIADEAVFYSGDQALRGKQVIVEAWNRFFIDASAPFSWQPQSVEVLDSGRLALSSGPVRDADGNVVGIFNSIWRRESDGRWLIVFDKGCDICPAPSN